MIRIICSHSHCSRLLLRVNNIFPRRVQNTSKSADAVHHATEKGSAARFHALPNGKPVPLRRTRNVRKLRSLRPGNRTDCIEPRKPHKNHGEERARRPDDKNAHLHLIARVPDPLQPVHKVVHARHCPFASKTTMRPFAPAMSFLRKTNFSTCSPFCPSAFKNSFAFLKKLGMITAGSSFLMSFAASAPESKCSPVGTKSTSGSLISSITSSGGMPEQWPRNTNRISSHVTR